MKLGLMCGKWRGMRFALSVGVFALGIIHAYAEVARFGINWLNGEEPVEFYADTLEVHGKERVAIFSGNVSVTQGRWLLKTLKLVVHYGKKYKEGNTNKVRTESESPIKSGSTVVEKMEALGTVYIKTGTQITVSDRATFDKKSGVVILTGKVVLTDGDNVAQGCRLTANIKTGRASLAACEVSDKKGRASIILNIVQKSGH